MASKIRSTITNQILDILSKHNLIKNNPNLKAKVRRSLSLPYWKRYPNQFHINLVPLLPEGFATDKLISELRHGNNKCHEILDVVPIEGKSASNIAFHFCPSSLTKAVLETSSAEDLLDKSDLSEDEINKNIIVEFSSPNIAKPFHVGHFRSTIIGSVLSNLKQAQGHNVTRINYLGDWGTQFGVLQIGYQKYGDENLLRQNAINHLYNVYVKINDDIKLNPEWFDRAKETFFKMESGDEDLLNIWKRFRSESILEYKAMYNRIGVTFDLYHGESMYGVNTIQNVIQKLQSLQSYSVLPETNQGAIKLSKSNGERICPIIKSDGTLLYLTRDIAAAIDRKNNLNMDEMLYVVENGQADHFQCLFDILDQMSYPWSKNLKHVKFGRIHGMSTRSGNAIFLKDLLDGAKAQALNGINNSSTTKISENEKEEVGEILGVSSVIINDLRSALIADYKFDWNRALHFKGDSGISLQYTHARLCNLQRNCNVDLEHNVDSSEITENEALALIQHIAMFDQVVWEAAERLEPCVLVQYLFQLSRVINAANKKLQVKGLEDSSKAKARLKLFHVARLVLAHGLKLVGVKPLPQI